MENKKVKPSKRKNGKPVDKKAKSEKQKEPAFKNRVVDPSEIIKVRVDHKTVLEIPKGKNIDEVVARYHDRQARALNQFKR